jgi:hypothetical protein
MKIYLDIDETLINTDIHNIHPANYLKEFLEFMLKNHDVYWLTTHCSGDATEAVLWMSKYVSPDIVDLIMRIKPTKWKVSKTEAINMNEDFLWFDDDPTPEDIENLKRHNKLGSLIKVNLDENPDILGEFLGVS